jgi:hypothetical protein
MSLRRRSTGCAPTASSTGSRPALPFGSRSLRWRLTRNALERFGVSRYCLRVAGARSWLTGRVDPDREHIRLVHGEAFAGAGVEVARLAKGGEGGGLVVEFLLDAADSAEAVDLVRGELNFYLDEIEHPGGDAWSYAIYHCSTMANVYSKVHWSYFNPEEAAEDA